VFAVTTIVCIVPVTGVVDVEGADVPDVVAAGGEAGAAVGGGAAGVGAAFVVWAWAVGWDKAIRLREQATRKGRFMVNSFLRWPF
jgi:hypothetical protein